MIDGIIRAFHGGGLFMWPIAVVGMFCVGIMIERIYVLYFKVREDKDTILNGLNKHIFRGDMHGAIRFLDAQRPGPLTRTARTSKCKRRWIKRASVRFRSSRPGRATSPCSRTRRRSSACSAPSSV